MFNNQNNPDEYFAAARPEETASSLLSKARSFYTMLTANAYLEKIAKMWRAYNGAYQNDIGYGHMINFTGEQGELVSLPVNHFRNIAQHIFVMITANRPSMQARAINTDYKSLAQTYLADGILDYYMREKNLEKCIQDATEMSIVLGSSYVKLEWNATAGDEYDVDPETGEVVHSGEVEFSVLSPFDVVFDGTKETWNNDWLLVRSFQNRFNLMAKYPEHADKIRGMQPKGSSQIYRLAIWSNDETDDIPVYEFYHKRTEAMPDGRYLLFLDAECILLDGKMPYRVMPIFRIVPSQIMGTPYGYSPMFDIFPIQEIINSTYSTIATNQTAFGVQNIYVPRGSDISIAEVSSGMNLIEANGKPEPLNLTETPQELFTFLNMMVQAAETISGVSSTTRGDPAASLKSGTALALVQSMSLQFMSGLQQSYVKLIEDIGSALIQILKDFAKTPKTIALVGKNNRPLLKEFTGENINAINRVIVDVGNPLANTVAGRVQMAEQLAQMHLLKSPEQYFQVINTGSLASVYQGEMSQLLLIVSENERLMEGQAVQAVSLDQHQLHIQEHQAVLADPDLRTDPTLVTNTMNHIQQHIDYLRNVDPQLLILLGQQPLQPIGQQAPQGMPQGPQAPGPTQQGPGQGAGGGPTPQQAVPHGRNGSPSKMMQTQQGNIAPGENIAHSEMKNMKEPGLPKPPKPFNNMPVTAGQIVK